MVALIAAAVIFVNPTPLYMLNAVRALAISSFLSRF